MRPLESLRARGLVWTLQPEFRAGVLALCRELEDPGRLPGSQVVKATPGRSVWRVSLAGQASYVKRYRTRGPAERIKYLLAAPRALAEWRAALALARAGIDAAEPLAVGVGRRGPWLSDAFFVSRELPGRPWPEGLDALRRAGAGVEPLLRETLALLERLLQAGIVHPDLHGGNMLVRLEAGGPHIGLVDLHSVRAVGRVGARARGRMRAKLAHSLWLMLEPAEFDRALSLLDPGRERALARRVEGIERTRLRSRARRCVRPSTHFARDRRAGWTVWRRREVPLDELLRLAGDRASTPGGSARLCIDGQWREVLVRRRAGPGWLRAWKAAHARSVRGIPTPRSLACLERRGVTGIREALLVTEYLPGAVRLDRVEPERRGEALARAALATAALHHQVGLTVAVEELLAQPLSGSPEAAPGAPPWRVLATGSERLPRDRAVAPGRAAADLAAIRRVTSPSPR